MCGKEGKNYEYLPTYQLRHINYDISITTHER